MLCTPPILAVGLIAPAFAAAGLGLAALPIVIHLLNRRRFKTEPWAAMEFLRRAVRKNRRRLRFESWLLLAVRCAAVALAGLALARPTSCGSNALTAAVGQRSGLHVIVIDNAYTMAYRANRPNAATQLDQAKLLAKQSLDRLSGGSESVMVITAAKPATAVLARPTFDLDAARAAIDRIQQSFAGADLPGALRLADAAARANATPQSRFLDLYTDGSRAAWTGPASGALAELGPALAKSFQWTHFNLGLPDASNVAASALAATDPLVTTAFSTALAGNVDAFANAPPPAVDVQWKMDGIIHPGGGAVQWRTGATAGVTLDNLSLPGGPHVVSLSAIPPAGGDALPADDTRWRVINVASTLRVLLVEGGRGSTAGQAGTFLAAALSPPAAIPSTAPANNGGSAGYVQCDRISDIELPGRVLDDDAAVVLANVSRVQSAEADTLRRFVDRGGVLMIFAGDAVSADNYNAELLPRKLLPGPIGSQVTVAADAPGYTLDFNPDRPPPLLADFAGSDSGLSRAEIFTHWQVALAAESNASRVLTYLPPGAARAASRPAGNAGDPAVVVSPVGGGRVVLVTTSPDSQWTTLATTPAFLPLVHDLLAGTVRSDDGWLNLAIGQPLVLPATLKLGGLPILLAPAGGSVAMDVPAGGVPPRSPPLDRPGIYTLRVGDVTYPVAVNMPPDAADVRMLGDAAIRHALGGADVQAAGDALPSLAVRSADDRLDFGWIVMVGVLAFLMAESLLALRFGRGRSRDATVAA